MRKRLTDDPTPSRNKTSSCGESMCGHRCAGLPQHLALGCGTTNLAAVSVASGFHSRMPDCLVRALGTHFAATWTLDTHLCCLSGLRNAPLVDNGCAAGIDSPQMRSVGTPALGPCRALGGKLVPVLLGWRHFHMGLCVVRFLATPPESIPTRPGWIRSKQYAPCLQASEQLRAFAFMPADVSVGIAAAEGQAPRDQSVRPLASVAVVSTHPGTAVPRVSCVT